ncbi:hypothetical protein PG991_010898 [Apiospora marii]|uniref:Uncharacterized protein n=1 Tax=Apiospora marii TaxID=335849 RepID=A0ABR1RCL5_9PEZI
MSSNCPDGRAETGGAAAPVSVPPWNARAVVPYEALWRMRHEREGGGVVPGGDDDAAEPAEGSAALSSPLEQGGEEDLTFVRFPQHYFRLPRLERHDNEEIGGDSLAIAEEYPDPEIFEDLTSSHDQQSNEQGDDQGSEQSYQQSNELQRNTPALGQETHTAIAEFVKEVVLEPVLHKDIEYAAIAPTSGIQQGRENWRDASQTVSYGLFNNIPIVILPVEDIRTAFQSLQGVLPKDIYNYKVASDVSGFWEEPRAYPLHQYIDAEVQRLRIINVLIHGWQQVGILERSPDIHAGNIQSWMHLLAVKSDPLGHHRQLHEEEAKNWLVKRFIEAAQTCNLLPKCPWIRRDNASDWLHLFVPINNPWVSIPPGTRDQGYWTWHNSVARQYWKRCGITNEECLRLTRLWGVYRPDCTPFLFLDEANIVTPVNKPDEIPPGYFCEMVTTRRRRAEQVQSATHMTRPGVPPFVDDGGTEDAGFDHDGDVDENDDSAAGKSSVQKFREAATNLHQNTQQPSYSAVPNHNVSAWEQSLPQPSTGLQSPNNFGHAANQPFVNWSLFGASPSIHSSEAGYLDEEEDDSTAEYEMSGQYNNTSANGGRDGGGPEGRGGRRELGNFNLRQNVTSNAAHSLPARPPPLRQPTGPRFECLLIESTYSRTLAASGTSPPSFRSLPSA